MNEFFEFCLKSYQDFPTGDIVIVFSDNLCFHYSDKISLDEDCIIYDTNVEHNLRKYIVCYCAQFGGSLLEGKKLVFDLTEPNGNILRIV